MRLGHGLNFIFVSLLAQVSAAKLARSRAEADVLSFVNVHNLSIEEGDEADRHPFEGIGALSAGASSRLLQDYPAAQRDAILDLLFKPEYGASLQVLKVEIGADTQSTDGTEPSHMRFRGEKPDCTRGYEAWLLKEAKARNPEIRTYGLAWGVPGWIGNDTFFSEDNIFYHVSWLRCIKETLGFEIDYVGIWNERQWGAAWYIFDLTAAIKEANLTAQLVMLDSAAGQVPKDFLDEFARDERFRDTIAAVGLHYPCSGNAALADAIREHHSTRLWSSEETSTVADWGGAGCWGRMINQNYVRMNATSSIAWSLIWSVYPNVECFGNGLLYAFEPWSGHYEVMPPVWTSAHTTQFTKFGWVYLPTGYGAGLLPEGGTYVTIASPDLTDFTIVLETLQGSCMYNGGCFHTTEAKATQVLSIQLGSQLAAAGRGRDLEVWATNRSHWFQRHPDTQLTPEGFLRLEIPVDAVVTISTLKKATKEGKREPAASGKAVPPAKPFPLPFIEDFEDKPLRRSPAFFADQGGAFEVAEAPGRAKADGRSKKTSRVLEQQILELPIGWGAPTQPLTLLGDANWTDLKVAVDARFESPQPFSATPLVPFGHAVGETGTFVGIRPPEKNLAAEALGPRHMSLCARALRYTFFQAGGQPEGYCLRVIHNSTEPQPIWLLTVAAEVAASGHLSTETAQKVLSGEWIQLAVEAHKARITAFVEGIQVAEIVDATYSLGQVGLGCGYHKCQFDDFQVRPSSPKEQNMSGLLASSRPLVKIYNPVSFHYNARSCDPSPTPTKKRSDFTGMVGLAFVPKQLTLVVALGRIALRGGQALTAAHTVELLEFDKVTGLKPVTAVVVSTLDVKQVGVIAADDGFHYAELQERVVLKPNQTYVLASSEISGGDLFFDKDVVAEAAEGFEIPGPAYGDSQGWHIEASPNLMYGPLNALVLPAEEAERASETTSSTDAAAAARTSTSMLRRPPAAPLRVPQSTAAPEAAAPEAGTTEQPAPARAESMATQTSDGEADATWQFELVEDNTVMEEEAK